MDQAVVGLGISEREKSHHGPWHSPCAYEDPTPNQTVQFYVDNLGATLIAEVGARGYRVNLHGLTLNVTTLIDTERREQHYGVERIAVDTNDYPGTLGPAPGQRRARPRGAAAH